MPRSKNAPLRGPLERPCAAQNAQIERDFNPAAPNRLCASDINYVPTWRGTLCLASVIDCYSRRVVGWSMRNQLPAELVVDALEMAISRRRPAGQLVYHSDQGSQYVALIFGQRLRKAWLKSHDNDSVNLCPRVRGADGRNRTGRHFESSR